MKTSEFTKFICDLAEKSGEVIRSYYAMDNIVIETKDDQTPVTRADREAEALMRELIRKAYPDHGIIGEEFGEENTSSEFVWTLDPIDGTISFTSGCPLFGTLISLLHENRPVVGAINLPILNQLCIGDLKKTTVNGRTVQLRNVTRLSEAILLTTDVAAITKSNNKEGFDALIERTHLFRTWGDCYGYLLVASGRADIMLDLNMATWDIMPLIPIIEGANGVITTWSGRDASEGTSCLVANSVLHPKVLEILNG